MKTLVALCIVVCRDSGSVVRGDEARNLKLDS